MPSLTSPAFPQTIILMGVCGAGKSHLGAMLATQLGAAFADSDDDHLPENRAKLAAGAPLTDEDRRPWYANLRRRITETRERGESLVMACSALHPMLRDWLRGGDSPEKIRFILLESPRTELEARLKTRTGHFMPASLLDSQLLALEITDDLIRIKNEGSAEMVIVEILSRLK